MNSHTAQEEVDGQLESGRSRNRASTKMSDPGDCKFVLISYYVPCSLYIQASLLVSLLAIKEVPKSVRLRLLATKGEFTSYQVSSIASIKDQ